MLLIDLEQGRIIEDEEIKRDLAEAAPYEEWLKQTQYKLEELPAVVEGADAPPANDPSLLLDRQQAFGYTQEDVSRFLEPMAEAGNDPFGRMGVARRFPVLSPRPKLPNSYFKRNSAKVTNPPIDPTRGELNRKGVVLERGWPERESPGGR